jgi:hypothetical protein
MAKPKDAQSVQDIQSPNTLDANIQCALKYKELLKKTSKNRQQARTAVQKSDPEQPPTSRQNFKKKNLAKMYILPTLLYTRAYRESAEAPINVGYRH